MNAKRQTVWLVSMLSLMVVLSAYYLFTDNTDQLNQTTEQLQNDGKEAAAGQITEQDGTITVDEQPAADAGEESDAADVAGSEEHTDAESAEEFVSSDETAQTDGEILDQLSTQASTGNDFFISAQMKRHEDLQKQSDQLMKIITDSSKDSATVGKAYDDMRKLEESQTKIENIEDELMRDFPNAVVMLTPESSWQVVVQSEKLDKGQAVSILDLVTKELNVEPGQVVVKYQP